jgi:hypothetical protein
VTARMLRGAPGIAPHELMVRLLHATAQDQPGAIDPARLLSFLGLDFLPVDFATALRDVLPDDARNARALLSSPDHLVAVDAALDPQWVRFSTLHEIAHYVLQDHRHALYLCDAEGLSHRARLDFEVQANLFAADLLFKGHHFTVEAQALPVSAATVKALALKYQASFEATARRLVEKHHAPVMLVVCERQADRSVIDASQPAVWCVKHCSASTSFRTRWFARVEGEAPAEIAAALSTGGRDLADSIVVEMPLAGDAGGAFRVEWYFDQGHVMGLAMPKKGGA